jgi:hypothetical protein
MDIGVSVIDGLGVFLMVSVLFLPVVWFVGYFIWEAMHWKARSSIRYTLEEIQASESSREEPQSRAA